MSERLKKGELVRFKDVLSTISKFFQGKTENLEIREYHKNGTFSVYNIDKSDYFYVNESELELMKEQKNFQLKTRYNFKKGDKVRKINKYLDIEEHYIHIGDTAIVLEDVSTNGAWVSLPIIVDKTNLKISFSHVANYELVKPIKNKFQVGDIIVGNIQSEKYSITSIRYNFVGEVVRMNNTNDEDEEDIKVKVLECDMENEIRSQWWVNSNHFDLKDEIKKLDFNKTKVYVATSKESEAVQKRMFELGFDWGYKKRIVINLKENYLYFKKKTITYGNTPKFFEEHNFKKVTIQDILGEKDIKESPIKKLIKNKTNKMEQKEIEKIDSKILKAAKEEIELERAKRQQEEAAEYYRNLMNEKDEVEKVVKNNQEFLKDINKQLKVFSVK